jgi:methylmalonyl-CoA mutase
MDPIEPLTWMRWSEPFERLRDMAEARTPRPAVFFANLGPLAEFSPRANFAQNLFAIGGVGAIGPDAPYPDDAARLTAFGASGASVAVLSGSDARYAAEAASAAQALKATGAAWIIYAGKPADEAGLRAAGIDQFVFAGQDTLGALETLHAALGVA